MTTKQQGETIADHVISILILVGAVTVLGLAGFGAYCVYLLAFKP